MVDEGLLNPESVPAGSLNPTPPMDEFNISGGRGGGEGEGEGKASKRNLTQGMQLVQIS